MAAPTRSAFAASLAGAVLLALAGCPCAGPSASAATTVQVNGSFTSASNTPIAAGRGAAASGPGRWVQLSSGSGLQNGDDPSVHRFGKTLQVVWEQDASDSTQALHTRILAASGAPASANETLLRWNELHDTPAITSLGGGRLIAFTGLQDDNTPNPYSAGYGYALTSSNGTKWTLARDTLGSDPFVGDEDVADMDGTPAVVYTTPAGSEISYRANFDTLPPAAGARDSTTSPSTRCCAYHPGVGYDPTSRQTWTAWYSNSGKAGTDGIDAQRIFPSAGRQVHAPHSASKFDGQIASDSVSQRVQVVARRGGGLYTAYGVGYPTASTIALWRLGSRTPLELRTHDQIQTVGDATAPGGRLWVFWSDLNTGLLHAVRTNTAGTRFGAVRSVRPPPHTGAIWQTAGDGGNGRLDLVVNVSVASHVEMFASQVLPGLSARVSPGVTSAHGGKVTVTVTDAGAAVRGATVHFGRTTKKTNAHGQVHLTITKHTGKGRHAISFGDRGYAGGTVHVRVG